MNELQAPDWVVMSRRERDVLAVMRSVVNGERTRVQAAQILKKSVRQIRRLQRKWEVGSEARRRRRVRTNRRPITRGELVNRADASWPHKRTFLMGPDTFGTNCCLAGGSRRK